MTGEVVNRALLPGSLCFGCGADNPRGLHVAIMRDGERPDRLLGTIDPSPEMVGFPGITHGGVIYTALDCLAAWVPTVLRPEARAIWILRSASIKYRRAAPAGRPISLAGTIAQEGKPGEPIVVHTEARGEAGELLAEADFKVVPLTPERFKEVAGLAEIPENWRRLLGEK